MKSNRKTHATLSMPFDIEVLSEIECYVCSHFTEVSPATESDGA